jgi:lipoprotein-anchoring transpeptidase ErfK/SrfK
LLLRFSQAGTIVRTGPWNKKAPLYSRGTYRFGLAVVLLALSVAQASAEDLLSANSGRSGYQPQLATMLPSYGDPWSGLRHASDVRSDVRYEAPTSEMNPRFSRRVLDYPTREKPGSIVIDTRGRYLYYVERQGKAIRYGIGVGRPGFEWAGVKAVSQKKEWPEWRPPADMLARRPDLPTYMAGGSDNPLGARAIYLGPSLYRIHGSNEPGTIGLAVSSGCIRMKNEDVIDLYDRVKIGTRVVVI